MVVKTTSKAKQTILMKNIHQKVCTKNCWTLGTTSQECGSKRERERERGGMLKGNLQQRKTTSTSRVTYSNRA